MRLDEEGVRKKLNNAINAESREISKPSLYAKKSPDAEQTMKNLCRSLLCRSV